MTLTPVCTNSPASAGKRAPSPSAYRASIVNDWPSTWSQRAHAFAKRLELPWRVVLVLNFQPTDFARLGSLSPSWPCLHGQGTCCRTAEQRDELATIQPIKLHLIPRLRPSARYRIGGHQATGSVMAGKRRRSPPWVNGAVLQQKAATGVRLKADIPLMDRLQSADTGCAIPDRNSAPTLQAHPPETPRSSGALEPRRTGQPYFTSAGAAMRILSPSSAT